MIEHLAPGVHFEHEPVETGIVPVPTATAGFIGFAPWGYACPQHPYSRSRTPSACNTPVSEFGEECGLTRNVGFACPFHEDVMSETPGTCGACGERLARLSLCQSHPHLAHLVTSWSRFCDMFGDADGNPYVADGYLAHAVNGFFENGGTRCYVVHVPFPESEWDTTLGETGIVPADLLLDALIGVTRGDVREQDRRGVAALLAADEVTMVSVPDLMFGLWQRDKLRPTPALRCPYCNGQLNGPVDRCFRCKRTGGELVRSGTRDSRLVAVLAAQIAIVQYCEWVKDRIAILDPIPGLSPQDLYGWVQGAGYGCQRGHATLYYPWIRIEDPRTGEDKMVPPCGHVAGVWARNDEERGVHQSPANLEIVGVLDVERGITEGEQQLLNPLGVNCLRAFPGRGIYVWGGRTLATDASWRYLNVRRMMNFIEKSVERGTDWIVFQPNNPQLWDRITRYVGAFLTGLWREGMLAGATAEQAFRVSCNDETNPPEAVAVGQIVTEILVAPLRPAEFIVLRVQQWHGTGAVV